MSKSTAFEVDFLELIFNGTAIPDLADNDATTPAASLHVSLHSSDPGESGTQATNELNTTQYAGYARVAVARTTGGWTVANPGGVGTVTPVADITFPPATVGSTGVTATHFAIGTSPTVGAAGYLLYKGTVTPNISITNGVTPRLTTATKIEED